MISFDHRTRVCSVLRFRTSKHTVLPHKTPDASNHFHHTVRKNPEDGVYPGLHAYYSLVHDHIKRGEPVGQATSQILLERIGLKIAGGLVILLLAELVEQVALEFTPIRRRPLIVMLVDNLLADITSITDH